jgi:indole-3-glycerol phosphate synthase
VATYLDEILVAHRHAAEQDERDLTDLERAARSMPAPRSLIQALRAPGLSVIAEIKRRSPSKGPLAPDLDPVDLAVRYEEAGAAALSVLTDHDFFGGSFDDLARARGATSLPVLRKDFTVSRRDVFDARAHGADALLLIVAALDDRELAEFHAAALDLGLDVLVEVHDDEELERALAVGATLVGVNQRDLKTFEVDGERAARMIESFPPEVVAVAESGVASDDDAARLAAVGFDAVLVGEHLVTAAVVESTLQALVGHEVGRRGSVKR